MGIFDFLKSRKLSTNGMQSPLDKIEFAPGIRLPRAFAEFWPAIEKTKMPSVGITIVPNASMSFSQSKFGHYPCLPADFEYPKDSDGHYMFPLAQINWKEVPPLHGYPTSGFLQFYISAHSDVYGLDFDNGQSQLDFRVLFFEEEEVNERRTDFSFLTQAGMENIVPVDKPYALKFAPKDDYFGIGDFRNRSSHEFNIAKLLARYPETSDQLENALYESLQCMGHKIGGYAYFIQSDPRDFNNKYKDYILLLQMDSEGDMMWGDVGVANFFIHPDDLAKKDFSKVLYNWDCS